MYRSIGDYAQAKVLLEQAVAIEPNFYNSRYNLGMVLVFLKEWKEAKEHLEKAIALGASEPQVHFELAKALRGLGENERAAQEMKEYQKLKKADEANVEAASSSAQGDTELAAGKVQEAIAHYREATESAPDNATYKYQLSIALRQAGDTEGERVQLEQAVKLNPQLAGAQNELGYLLSRGGDSAGAIEHFRWPFRLRPPGSKRGSIYLRSLPAEHNLPRRAKRRQRRCVWIQAMRLLKNSTIVFRTTRPLSKLTLDCDSRRALFSGTIAPRADTVGE